MKKIVTLAALGLLIAAPVSAQTVYDAAKITNKDLNGTARFVGMSGAMGTLGGDISTIGTNPAGIGVYRSNDAMVPFGSSSYGTESNYVGNRMNSDKMRASFDNAGFMLSSKIGNATALRYMNFGLNYHKAKFFYKNMSMGGNLGDYTQTDYIAAQAEGIKDWSGDIYTDPEVGWPSALGYDGYLITDLIVHNGQGDVPSGYVPYMIGGKQVKNLNGDLIHITPGKYGGMSWGGSGSFHSEERGGIDQCDFSILFNINDRVYLGVTVGAYAIDYSKYTFYDENYLDKVGNATGQGYNLQSWNRIHGPGPDVKSEAIVRPFEYSPSKIGLAIHTPTYHDLDYKTSARLESDVLNDLDIANESEVGSGVIGQYNIDTYDILKGDMVRQLQPQTPWTYSVSLGCTIGKDPILGTEYEYQDYSSMKFKGQEDYSDTFGYENSTTSMLEGVSTIRLGAEYKVIPQLALRAGYNYTSAIFNSDVHKDLSYNSIQTNTDFANTKTLSSYTLGIGYRGSMFYADLAYKYSSYKEGFHPFINVYMDGEQLVIGSPEVRIRNTRSQVLLTLGPRL